MSSAEKPHLQNRKSFLHQSFPCFSRLLDGIHFLLLPPRSKLEKVSNSSAPIPKNCRRRPEKMEYYSIKEKKMFTMSSQSIIDWTNIFFVEANKPKSDKCSQFCVTSVSMSRVEPAGTITVRIDLKSSAQIDPVSTQRTIHSTVLIISRLYLSMN